MRCIVAHTDLKANHPAYVSINEADDGKVEFTVRAASADGAGPGVTAAMTVTGGQFRQMVRDMQAALRRTKPKAE